VTINQENFRKYFLQSNIAIRFHVAEDDNDKKQGTY